MLKLGLGLCYESQMFPVQDQNDNSPQFNITSLTEEVLENSPVETFIADFDVIDIDNGISAEANFSLLGLDSNRSVKNSILRPF